MSDLGGFNANDVPEGDGFPVLPAGEYNVIICGSETANTSLVPGAKDGNGRFISLKLELQILNGEHQNKRLFDRLNFKRNPGYNGAWTEKDDTTVQIGAGNLSSICRAINVLTPRDSSELHNKPLLVKVVIKDSPEYGKQNNIKAYKPRNAGPAAGPIASGPSGQADPAGEFKKTETPWG